MEMKYTTLPLVACFVICSCGQPAATPMAEEMPVTPLPTTTPTAPKAQASLCHTWNGELLTSHGKPDPTRDVKGKVRFELRCDSTFDLTDATEGAPEKVAGNWMFTKDSLLILNVPREGELTRFKVLAWDDRGLKTFALEAPEEDVFVTYSAE